MNPARKQSLFSFAGLASVLALSVLASGCAMFRAPRETPPSQTLTFAGIREEVRTQFDEVTLKHTGTVTNHFVFPVSYTVEGENALDQLQILFDRYRSALGLDPVSIHDDSAMHFFDLLDTRAGSVMPDFMIRQKDIEEMTPILLESWLRQLKQETDRLRSGTDLPRPRKDR